MMSADLRRTSLRAVATALHLIVSFVRRGVCALRGHDMMLDFAPTRLSLRCAACGHNTPGWELDLKMRPASRVAHVRIIARTAPAVVKPQPQTAPVDPAGHACAA